ncbi:hypothetical protein Scep_029701 [Stephania cephalantha]|uniref:Uncharacterized protein n=1 Tax=Stephania cephalantha TaxID=152367 RepID=A0AAP0DY80_9MAGN
MCWNGQREIEARVVGGTFCGLTNGTTLNTLGDITFEVWPKVSFLHRGNGLVSTLVSGETAAMQFFNQV